MKYLIFLIVIISYLFSSVNSENSSIFTKEELEWIKNNPTIKVGVDEDWPPFDYINNEKKHNGISSDYLKIVSDKTGLKFDIYANSWHNVMEKIKNKELDILACAAKTPDRETFLDFTNPYLSLDAVIVGKKDLKLESFDDIKKYKVAVQKSDYIYDALKKRFPNIEFVFVESNSDALKFVSYGKADLYIDNLPTISYFIEKNLLTNLEIKSKADFEPSELSVAVIKEKNILKNIIEKVFKDISLEEKNKIQKKWAFSFDEKDVNFTKEELLWIKNNPVVKIGADANWPPFDYLNNSGIHDGISAEYINSLSKHTGLKFEVDSDIWNNLMTKIKDKKLDMMGCIAKTPERESFLNFTDPYLSLDILVISRKDVPLKNI